MTNDGQEKNDEGWRQNQKVHGWWWQNQEDDGWWWQSIYVTSKRHVKIKRYESC